MPSRPISPSTPPHSSHLHILLISLSISISSLFFLILLFLILYLYFSLLDRSPEALPSPELRRFTYDELKSATAGFDPARSLGRGGSGSVFRAVLSDGKTVAVKRVDLGARSEWEFQNELQVLSRLGSTRFVVSLLGYCEEKKRRCLVYEYLPNRSLQEALFNGGDLDWRIRFQIILHVAQGLAFLHVDCIPPLIHGDIKPSNVLLGADFSAKISDFGLAKVNAADFSQDCVMKWIRSQEERVPCEKKKKKSSSPESDTWSGNMRGTICYVAPEYGGTKALTEKADVYSLGVLILVIVSGRRPINVLESPMKLEQGNLVNWCRQLAQGGDVMEIVDPGLKKSTGFDQQKAALCINLALLCLQRKPELRPDSGEIVRILKGEMELPALTVDFSGSPFGSQRRRIGDSVGDVDP